jgi:hypothetical protein
VKATLDAIATKFFFSVFRLLLLFDTGARRYLQYCPRQLFICLSASSFVHVLLLCRFCTRNQWLLVLLVETKKCAVFN